MRSIQLLDKPVLRASYLRGFSNLFKKSLLLALSIVGTFVFVPLGAAPAQASNTIGNGDGNFLFTDMQGNADRPLRVWYHKPAACTNNSPIVIVMHGVNRDADRYAREWSPLAEKGNFIVICPQFLAGDYPTAAYPLGNVFDQNNQSVPPAKWTFSANEHLFDQVKTITGNRSERYYIYGHSAGGQFVHRFVLFMPNARYVRAVAANPGWYMMPDFRGHLFPYGLRNSGLEESSLKSAFARDFILMLGSNDLNADDPELNHSRRAEEQGATRFERGQNYFQAATAAAATTGTPLRWTLRTVPGANHSDRQMATAAAAALFN